MEAPRLQPLGHRAEQAPSQPRAPRSRVDVQLREHPHTSLRAARPCRGEATNLALTVLGDEDLEVGVISPSELGLP